MLALNGAQAPGHMFDSTVGACRVAGAGPNEIRHCLAATIDYLQRRPRSCVLTCVQDIMSTSLYPLASFTQIEKTPSREDGLPDYLEEDLRAYGCKLIHEAGILLKQCVRTPILHLHVSISNSLEETKWP